MSSASSGTISTRVIRPRRKDVIVAVIVVVFVMFVMLFRFFKFVKFRFLSWRVVKVLVRILVRV